MEEMTARMDKLGEQLNQTHLEGMQWKACALSWNDPKGEFQQALVQAISSKLGEQYRARERGMCGLPVFVVFVLPFAAAPC